MTEMRTEFFIRVLRAERREERSRDVIAALDAAIAALSHAAGQEAVAWRTIKPCGLRRHMTQAQYDANPNVQKWYEHFKCADCRAPAQPPASAGVGRDWRPAFEEWALRYEMNIERAKGHPLWIDGTYLDQDTQRAYHTWEAAMAASSGRKD